MLIKYITQGLILALVILNVGCSNVDNLAENQGANYGEIDNQRAAKFNLQLGLGYLEQGDVERAKGKLIKALKQAPYMPETHYNIAHFYYLIDEYELADTHFKKAISYSKNSSKGVLGTAKNNYGVFLCQTKRYQEAERQFLGAVDDPNYADTASAYENAGLCFLKAEEKDKAQYYFEKTIKQNPLSTKALIELSELYVLNNNYKQAKFYLERYDQLGATNKRSLMLSLKLAKAQGDNKKIQEITDLLFKKYPNLKNDLESTESYSKKDKSIYNNKLVKYTDIGELNTISSFTTNIVKDTLIG